MRRRSVFGIGLSEWEAKEVSAERTFRSAIQETVIFALPRTNIERLHARLQGKIEKDRGHLCANLRQRHPNPESTPHNPRGLTKDNVFQSALIQPELLLCHFAHCVEQQLVHLLNSCGRFTGELRYLGRQPDPAFTCRLSPLEGRKLSAGCLFFAVHSRARDGMCLTLMPAGA